LADDESFPVPDLPGDLCEAYKPNQVCCPYMLVENRDGTLPLPLPTIGKIAPIYKEAYRMHWAEIERDYTRPCRGAA